MQIGQAVEDAVLEYFKVRDGREMINLMPDFHEDPTVTDDEDDGDDANVDAFIEQYTSREDLCQRTLDAIRQQVPILYQPSFQVGDCFVRADVMVLQPRGQYSLIEIKAKSWIRKEITHEGKKYKVGAIDVKFINDVSFQKYVINQALKSAWLQGLAEIYIYYLNKGYVKNGQLDFTQLIASDQVDVSTTFTIEGGKKDRVVERLDHTLSSEKVLQSIDVMRSHLQLSEEEFNKIYPFTWTKYIEYFWEDRPFWTVMGRWIHHSKAEAICDFYYTGRHDILALTDIEKDCFNSKWKNGELWTSREFIELYCSCKRNDKIHIMPEAIKQQFSQLSYPICFYDYESVSTPIPFMDNTYPYQQVVVQYSLHKFYSDGSMKHYGGVLWWQVSKDVQVLQFEHANAVASESDKVVYGSYKDLLQAMLSDIGDDINSSFIVRYKPFENTRNKEIAWLFPDLADKFLKIIDNTFDLMDVFSQRNYFDPAFKGSCSIKKVLPVLVPAMNYDHLEVGNGAVAMRKLFDLISWNIESPDELIKNLLIYCGQDSLAMVRIFEKILKVL